MWEQMAKTLPRGFAHLRELPLIPDTGHARTGSAVTRRPASNFPPPLS
jgi:hypothetical protein